ncbi:hypothetical protein C8J55DRAFT_558162 [Lentinula edodes]|uniref:Uncharacterized protein n=1 Tax=Lentinula lateritia TaxID=40482 RepID=A0A9W9DVK1_9AGAR|nr:hypothetical protein C8J55DRAFT_558162 [Lentinula edodes]
MAINHPEWYQGLQPSVSGAATEQPFLTCKSKPHRDMESEAKAAHKQARMEQADTFRGVHLDPNAHHWNEMEEDDDHFLDGIIEFGDGRQYKADTTEGPMPSACPPEVNTREPTTSSEEHPEAVRKEDRFADNFDRSWPCTKDVSTLTSDFAHLPSLEHRTIFLLRPLSLPILRWKRRGYSLTNGQTDWSLTITPGSWVGLPNVQIRDSQLPPHLLNGPPITPSFERRQSSRDSRYSARPLSSAGHSSVRHRSQSPVLSHVHAAVSSPITVSTESPVSTPQVSAAVLEDIKKDLMQSAAARAKQRRQQEEGEREKEKERARRKAAEIEAGLVEEKEKAEQEKVKVEASSQHWWNLSSTKEAKVSAIIEEAVSSVQTKPASIPGVNGVSFEKSPLRRLSTTRMPPQDASCPPFARKSSSFALPTPATPFGTAESWRSKPSAVAPPPSPNHHQQLQRNPMLCHLKVVDYSDLAEFMGVPEKIEEEQSKDLQVTHSETVSPSKSRRPVGSDFFDEESPSFIVSSTSTVRSDAGAWETNNEVPAVISVVDEKCSK